MMSLLFADMISWEVVTLNNKLGGFEPICDSTGKITGYKTAGGADTVFPFRSDITKLVAFGCSTFKDVASVTVPKDEEVYVYVKGYQSNYHVVTNIYINDILKETIYPSSQYTTINVSKTYTCRKGDVVKVSASNSGDNSAQTAYQIVCSTG